MHGKPKEEKYLDPAIPSPHEANWLPWAAERLEERDIPTVVPALPKPYAPDYEAWRETVERQHIDDGTVLIGLSAGAGFIVRYLSERSGLHVAKAVLVAPWLDPNRKYSNFMNLIPGLLSDALGAW